MGIVISGYAPDPASGIIKTTTNAATDPIGSVGLSLDPTTSPNEIQFERMQAARDSVQLNMEEIQGPTILAVRDTSNKLRAVYDQFCTLSMQLGDREFRQAHLTFGAEMMEGYRREPRIYTFSVLLPFTSDEVKRDPDDPAKVVGNYAGNGIKIFQYLYDKYFRATALADSIKLASGPFTLTLHVKGYIFYGAVLSYTWRYSAEEPNSVRGSLSVYVYDISSAPSTHRGAEPTAVDNRFVL